MKEDNKNFTQVGQNQTMAVNMALGPDGYVRDDNMELGAEYDIKCYPFTINHYNVLIETLANNDDIIMKSKVEDVINEVAAAYYVDDNRPSNDAIYTEVKSVLTHSMVLLASVLTLHRLQNSRKMKDERDRNIAYLLNNIETQNIGEAWAELSPNNQVGNWSITNVDWAQNYLEKYLGVCKLPKALVAQLSFIFSNYFKLQRDDATLRLADFYPAGVNFRSQEQVITYLDTQVTLLKESFSKYAYIKIICDQLGWDTNSWYNTDFLDLTRDLKGTTMHIYEDKYGDIECMLYSIAAYDVVDDTGNYRITSKDGIVSKPTNQVNFKDGVADMEDRVVVDVVSLTNFLRGGSVECFAISFMETRYNVSTQVSSYVAYAISPYQVQIAESATSAQLYWVANTNRMLVTLDPVGAPFIIIFQGANYKISIVPGSADFLMSVGDIKLVRACSAAYLYYGESKHPAFQSVKYLAQTIKAENVTN